MDKLQLEQIIFNPIKIDTPVGNNTIDFENKNSKIIYSEQLKKYHKVFYRRKINFLFNDLQRKYDLSGLDVTHATTLFSDGGLALLIKKKYHIPYVVTIRATDLSVFLKFRPDLYFLAIEILKESSRIVFISDSLKRRFFGHYLIKKHKITLENKCLIKYNGIDDFWLENLVEKKDNVPSKILYIGRLVPRKNVVNLATSILQLNANGLDCELHIVGNGGEDEDKIKEISKANYPIITYHGAINDMVQLKKMYNNSHIFALPAHGETFGLVYIEALTQGLPILCCENEGVDGVFEMNIGEICKTGSVSDITNSLQKLIANYKSYTLNKINFALFNWNLIAQDYLNLYHNINKR